VIDWKNLSVNIWNTYKEYILWGAGKTGREFINMYRDKLNISAIIDSDPKKAGTKHCGVDVIQFSNYLTRDNKPLIIITTGVYHVIRELLENNGFNYNVDFMYDYIFDELYQFYHKGILSLFEYNICITSKCTLNCESCNMRIPYFLDKRDFLFDDIICGVDKYFKWVDHVRYFVILGGEALLHAQLAEICEYVALRYRDRIQDFNVATNATILPSARLIELAKRYSITIQLSDYTQLGSKYKDRYKEIVEILENNGVTWYGPHWSNLSQMQAKWLDYGWNNLGETDAQLREKFSRCNCPWRAVYNGRFYFCHMHVSALRAGLHPFDENDSFDLSDYSPEKKEALLRYDLRELPNGYLSYCRICKGCSSVNDEYITPAIQINKSKNAYNK